VPFDKIPSVYFTSKIIFIYFSIGNGQPQEPALCQLYRHTFVPREQQQQQKRHDDSHSKPPSLSRILQVATVMLATACIAATAHGTPAISCAAESFCMPCNWRTGCRWHGRKDERQFHRPCTPLLCLSLLPLWRIKSVHYVSYVLRASH